MIDITDDIPASALCDKISFMGWFRPFSFLGRMSLKSVMRATVCLAALGICSPVHSQADDFRFNPSTFKKALAQPYNRDSIRPFYRRPQTIPWRQASNLDIPAVRALGEKLFHDTTLADTPGMGCVTCHQPQVAFSDNVAHSNERSRRRSMTLLNLAWNYRFTWTGEVRTMMEQAAFAIVAPGGMNTSMEKFAERVKARPDYAPLVKAAYHGNMDPAREISRSSLTFALEIYMASLVSGLTSFDRWIAGDETAITDEAKRGFDIFNSSGRCATCHMSWRFTDGELHDIGLAPSADSSMEGSLSGFRATRFKTPGLRELEVRKPFMHNGSLGSLEDVLNFYNRGGDVKRPTTSTDIQKLNLHQTELQALKAFLHTLSEYPAD